MVLVAKRWGRKVVGVGNEGAFVVGAGDKIQSGSRGIESELETYLESFMASTPAADSPSHLRFLALPFPLPLLR